MLIYYRLPGAVASFALIYYALVVLAIFRLIPVTLTLAGIAGFVLSVGMAVDANILIFERTKEELRLGKPLPAAIEAGFNRAWNSILDSNVSSLITAGILYWFGSSTIRGFALVLIIGVLVSMFTAITVTRTILRLVVRQDWARKAALFGVRQEEFVAGRTGRPRRFAERPARVFDIIGRRRWFFAFSLLITIPGLLFILLTPITGARTASSSRSTTPAGPLGDPVRQSERHGRRSRPCSRRRASRPTVTAPARLLRHPAAPIGLAGAVARPDAGPAPVGVPERFGRPRRRRRRRAERRQPAALGIGRALRSASASPRARRAQREPVAVAERRPPEPVAVALAEPVALRQRPAEPQPEPDTARRHHVPTSGEIGEVAAALQAQLGPIAEQRRLTTVGPVVSADLISQAISSSSSGSLGILIWITVRFRDLRFGVTALVALLHDVIVVLGIFAMLGTLFNVQVDALFVTAMLTVIGFCVHDTIVVFDRIRENRARHAGEPFDRIVNHSILQTFGRSINTSFTVVLTLLALFLFGGAAIRTFVLALLIGIISGTYSSIFNASPLLVTWHDWDAARKARESGRPTPPHSLLTGDRHGPAGAPGHAADRGISRRVRRSRRVVPVERVDATDRDLTAVTAGPSRDRPSSRHSCARTARRGLVGRGRSAVLAGAGYLEAAARRVPRAGRGRTPRPDLLPDAERFLDRIRARPNGRARGARLRRLRRRRARPAWRP